MALQRLMYVLWQEILYMFEEDGKDGRYPKYSTPVVGKKHVDKARTKYN